MAGYINVGAAIQEAERLLKQKDQILQAIGIVRTDLRNAVTLKQATSEEARYVEDTFPVRERVSKNKPAKAGA